MNSIEAILETVKNENWDGRITVKEWIRRIFFRVDESQYRIYMRRCRREAGWREGEQREYRKKHFS